MTKTARIKATIYTNSMLGVSKIEAHLLKHGTRPYAQYSTAPYVSYIPSRGRKARMIQGTYKPYILVLSGWGHPDLDTWDSLSTTDAGIICHKAKYSMCDARWATDADTRLDAYIAETHPKIIADYRHTKGFNSI